MKADTAEVISNDRSVRSVAKEYGICIVSLHKFCVKLSKNENAQTGYRSHNRIFDSQKGKILRDYVKRAANLYYGLSSRDLRTLTYQCAVYCKLKLPLALCETEMAGTVWLNAFLKISSTLSIRHPEATIHARAIKLITQVSIDFLRICLRFLMKTNSNRIMRLTCVHAQNKVIAEM
jgi:hypothetical protein